MYDTQENYTRNENGNRPIPYSTEANNKTAQNNLETDRVATLWWQTHS